jgi:hypothetical protein
MSVLQQNLLSSYRRNFAKSSYRQISQETGLSQSRVFRIFNGSEMKIGEYQLLLEQIGRSSSTQYNLLSLATQCIAALSDRSLVELESLLQRRIYLCGLQQTAN